MPIAPVLQRFVDDELALAPALIERVRAGTLQLLRDTKDGSVAPAERTHQFAIVATLQSQGSAYQREFCSTLHSGVRSSLAEQTDGGPVDASGVGVGLELMDESRVEIDIEISRAMQLIDTTAEWELRELQTFTSTLVGQTHVSAESNPFQPLSYATALWDAACAISTVQVQRTTLLRVSAGVAAGLLRKAWAAASTRLESQGIAPGIYRTVLLPPGSVPGRGTGPADSHRRDAMTSLLAAMPSGPLALEIGISQAVALGAALRPRGPANPVTAEFERALARLDELLRHLPAAGTSIRQQSASLVKRLDLHRAALMASTSVASERQVIALLARMFDSILTDPQVPAPFVAALARMQTFALRVALRDPLMLESSHHAVWRLLDSIGEAAAGYPQPNDPRAAALLELCMTLAEQLSRVSAPDSALCRRSQTHLDALLVDQLQTQLRAARSSVATLQLSERREVLEQQLARRLVDQMAKIRASPSVRRFVTGTWARVLAEAMLRLGEQADPTRGYIKLVDELAWSMQLPDHPQSRQRLIDLLPSMLARLRSGMALIDLPTAEQSHLLEELMAIHTEALRPGGRAGEAAPLTPEQIVQRIRDEVLPASTGHGGFGDSVIDLGSMETVPAELMPESPGDEPAQRVDALRPGDRRRLFVHGRWACVQVLWRSDQGLFFLFAGERATSTHSVTHRALEKLAAAGLLQPLEARSLVQRALDNVARELVRPAP